MIPEVPEVSIVIVNWNTGPLLRDCVRSLIEGNADVPYALIVVDNASRDNSVQLLLSAYPDITLLQNQHNEGFARANNRGFAYCKAPFVLLLNPDTRLSNGALRRMRILLAEHQAWGCVGAQAVDAAGTLQWTCYHFPTLRSEFYELFWLSKFFPRNRFFGRYLMSYWDHRTLREVDWVSGVCVMFRREILDRVGAFDEQYFLYGEDMEWCYRVRKKGYRIMYAPDVLITHYQGSSSDQVPIESLREKYTGRLRFFKTHYQAVAFCGLQVIYVCGFLLRAFVSCMLLWFPRRRAFWRQKRRAYLEVVSAVLAPL